MLISHYLIFTISIIIFVMIPGSGVLSCISSGLDKGYKASIPIILGILLGDIIYFSLSIAGLSLLLQSYPQIVLTLKILGAIYIAYLGVMMWLTGINNKKKLNIINPKAISILQGLSISLSNPKVMLFYLSILPGIITIGKINLLEYFILLLILSSCLILVLSLYSILAERSAKLIAPRHNHILHPIAGSLLIAASVLIILK